jgi:hypothetical protein
VVLLTPGRCTNAARADEALHYRDQQTRDGAKTVCKKLLKNESQGERGTTIVFCSTVRAANALLEKFRGGSLLGDDAYDSKRLISGGLRALVGTSILQMGIDKPGVQRALFSQLPLSIEELYRRMGRAGRGTTIMATWSSSSTSNASPGVLRSSPGIPWASPTLSPSSSSSSTTTTTASTAFSHRHSATSSASLARYPARVAAAPARRLTISPPRLAATHNDPLSEVGRPNILREAPS